MHPKSEHHLSTTADRRKLKEFSDDHRETYSVPASVAVSITGEEDELESTRKEHPADVPLHVLSQFYSRHPKAPGAGEVVKSIALLDPTTSKSSSRMPSDPFLDDDDDEGLF